MHCIIFFQCIQVENEYVKIHEELRKIRVPFARVDVDAVKELSSQQSTDLPALVFYRKKRAIPYNGVHSVAPVMAYASKLLSSPLQTLASVDEVISFMLSGSSADKHKYSLSTVFVVLEVIRMAVHMRQICLDWFLPRS